MKRGILPTQVLKAKQSIRAWERELQALDTCTKADQVLDAAESEMKLLDRMGNSGLKAINEDNPLKLKRKRKHKWAQEDDFEGDELRERADALNV